MSWASKYGLITKVEVGDYVNVGGYPAEVIRKTKTTFDVEVNMGGEARKRVKFTADGHEYGTGDSYSRGMYAKQMDDGVTPEQLLADTLAAKAKAAEAKRARQKDSAERKAREYQEALARYNEQNPDGPTEIDLGNHKGLLIHARSTAKGTDRDGNPWSRTHVADIMLLNIQERPSYWEEGETVYSCNVLIVSTAAYHPSSHDPMPSSGSTSISSASSIEQMLVAAFRSGER